MLSVKHLTKVISFKEILSDISFSIEKGEVVGIIGPNGAGKTTLFNILIGTIVAELGDINLSKSIQVDYAISRSEFFGDMTVINNLRLRCSMRQVNLTKLDEEKNPFRIDYLNSRFSSLSAGMKQKVMLTAQFLIHSDLIILDEPTNHLDIDSIFVLRDKILHLKKNGISFLVSSHGFNELEKICDRVMFIKNGKILLSENTKTILEKFGTFEEAYKIVLKF